MPLFTPRLSARGSSSTPRQAPAAAAPVAEFLADGSFVCAMGTLTAEEVSLAKVNFKKFDADADGVISRADFGEAMGKHDPSWRSESKQAQVRARTRAPHAARGRSGRGRLGGGSRHAPTAAPHRACMSPPAP